MCHLLIEKVASFPGIAHQLQSQNMHHLIKEKATGCNKLLPKVMGTLLYFACIGTPYVSAPYVIQARNKNPGKSKTTFIKMNYCKRILQI